MEVPIHGGNEEEAKLLERVHAIAHALARKVVRSKHRADDIAQDVALAFLKRQRSGREATPERLDAYVAKIVLRRRSDVRLRRRRAAARDWAFLSEITASRRAWMDPQVQWRERELAALYRRTLDSLPLACREAFVAVREQELSYAEAARRLGVSVKMIAKRITQAHRVFRAALREEGIRAPREKSGRTRYQPAAPFASVSRSGSTLTTAGTRAEQIPGAEPRHSLATTEAGPI